MEAEQGYPRNYDLATPEERESESKVCVHKEPKQKLFKNCVPENISKFSALTIALTMSQ